jgi:hypothetical protein
VLSDPAAQAEVFGGLTESTIIDRSGGVTLVRQRFAASPAADREVVVDDREESVPGGTRYVWRKSADQIGLRGDAVEVDVHEGAWGVHEEGGKVRVTYELRLALGGMLPPFVTSWAQGGALEQTLSELRRIARRD